MHGLLVAPRPRKFHLLDVGFAIELSGKEALYVTHPVSAARVTINDRFEFLLCVVRLFPHGCTKCGDCLPRCPESLNIPELLWQTHQETGEISGPAWDHEGDLLKKDLRS